MMTHPYVLQKPAAGLQTQHAYHANVTGWSRSMLAMWQALEKKQFFKLIAGGSLNELPILEKLSQIYSLAGADCLDIAPLPDVIHTVDSALTNLERLHPGFLSPLVMVSIPLDPDPHFRKIDLSAPDCILCEACLPVCPTEAFSIDSTSRTLQLHQPLCYGCGRCVPICPTEALTLHPFLVKATLKTVLSHPRVEAVELHTQYADPLMLETFLAEYGDFLHHKLIAYCFRPSETQEAFWQESLQILTRFAPGRVLLQLDGAPMSGSADPKASLPALAAATKLMALMDFRTAGNIPVTISGGINAETAHYLKTTDYRPLAGVGMGTFARQWVWQWVDSWEYCGPKDGSNNQEASSATQEARKLVETFKNR